MDMMDEIKTSVNETENGRYLPVLYTIPKWKLRITNKNNKVFHYLPEIDKYVSANHINSYLKKINKTPQEWFDRWHLRITVPSERPKCKVCGKESIFRNLNVGYGIECCDDPNHHKLIHSINTSIGTKTAFKNKEIRERISYGLKYIRYSKPEERLKISKATSKRYKDPEERRKTSEATSRGCMKPEVRRKKSDAYLNYMRTSGFSSNLRGIRSRIYSNWEVTEVYLDSTWELKFFNSCKECDKVSSLYRNFVLKIKYWNSRSSTWSTYITDFLLNNRYVIEIKPNYQLTNQVIIDKMNAAIDYCYLLGLEYVIITEDFLFNNGDPFYGSFDKDLDNSLRESLNKLK